MEPPVPAALVEDMRALQLVVQEVWRGAQGRLAPYGLVGPLQIVPSARALELWLGQQQPGTVRLLLLDFQVRGGTTLELLPRLRAPGHRHPALHAEAIVAGWSIHVDAADHFRRSGLVDGFISKERPVRTLVDDLLALLEARRGGARWVEL